MGLFGTDGVRGIAGKNIGTEMALRLARALGSHLGAGERVVVGRDTRISGAALQSALAAGLAESGVDVVLMGVAPSPAIAFAARQGFGAGVVVSASHNPPEFNGIKFFGADGFKLSDSIEAELERRLVSNDIGLTTKYGTISEDNTLLKAYCTQLLKASEQSLSGLKICVDCGNGAACATAASVFKQLGADVLFMAHRGNGGLINVGCGAMYPQGVGALVQKKGYDVGFAFDGDADRIIALSGSLGVLDGDAILYILAQKAIRQNRLKNNAVVGTVMSNSGLEQALNALGAKLIRTKVGDKYVIEAMRKQDLILGGESSGHIICFEHSTTGDGLLAALLICEQLKEHSVEELLQGYEPHVQIHSQLPLNKQRLSKIKSQEFEDFCEELKQESRVRLIVRPSGTEPILRITAESPNKETAQMAVSRLEKYLWLVN